LGNVEGELLVGVPEDGIEEQQRLHKHRAQEGRDVARRGLRGAPGADIQPIEAVAEAPAGDARQHRCVEGIGAIGNGVVVEHKDRTTRLAHIPAPPRRRVLQHRAGEPSDIHRTQEEPVLRVGQKSIGFADGEELRARAQAPPLGRVVESPLDVGERAGSVRIVGGETEGRHREGGLRQPDGSGGGFCGVASPEEAGRRVARRIDQPCWGWIVCALQSAEGFPVVVDAVAVEVEKFYRAARGRWLRSGVIHCCNGEDVRRIAGTHRERHDSIGPPGIEPVATVGAQQEADDEAVGVIPTPEEVRSAGLGGCDGVHPQECLWRTVGHALPDDRLGAAAQTQQQACHRKSISRAPLPALTTADVCGASHEVCADALQNYTVCGSGCGAAVEELRGSGWRIFAPRALAGAGTLPSGGEPENREAGANPARSAPP